MEIKLYIMCQIKWGRRYSSIQKKCLCLFIFCILNLSLCAKCALLTFSGKVVDNNGIGISDVVVNDGYNFTVTNTSGEWELETDTLISKFLSISLPSDYELSNENGLAHGFYASVRQIVNLGNKYNFVLRKRDKKVDKFHFVAISDPQVANNHDFNRWVNEGIRDLNMTIDSLKKSGEVIGMILGDFVFDNMALYGDLKKTLENDKAIYFHCIGNHDLDNRYQDLHNMVQGSPVYAELIYNQNFGPTDYSFNIGQVHIVTMKNINYVGGGYYIESLTDMQLDWLKKDLSYVPKGSLVFLNMHAACWNNISSGGNMRNAMLLQEILKDYNVHVFTGHTHFMQNNVVTSNIYEHNIGAICGTWWQGDINQCGTPIGYLVVTVNNNTVLWHYKSINKSFDYQFRLYNKGEFLSQKDYIVANIWDWDSQCHVYWFQNGQLMGEMEQFVDADELRASSLKKRLSAIKTSHLFRVKPTVNNCMLEVRFVNRFGEIYSQKINYTNKNNH